MLIYFDEVDFMIGVGILCLLLPVVWWQKRSLSYLLFSILGLSSGNCTGRHLSHCN